MAKKDTADNEALVAPDAGSAKVYNSVKADLLTADVPLATAERIASLFKIVKVD